MIYRRLMINNTPPSIVIVIMPAMLLGKIPNKTELALIIICKSIGAAMV
jgi:hypothetical protein